MFPQRFQQPFSGKLEGGNRWQGGRVPQRIPEGKCQQKAEDRFLSDARTPSQNSFSSRKKLVPFFLGRKIGDGTRKCQAGNTVEMSDGDEWELEE
ncbi:MAG: hypothetical protein D6728_12360 [Cyanobacteria bacterium J055]|nr:MAG: hypothetical protein D6728_12360 [Cyanobacteria bacterium J055]